MNKTEEIILGWCKKEGGTAWLSSAYFCKKINQTRSTVTKNLKGLFDKDILEREAISGSIQFANAKSWQYYYRLKKQKGVQK